MHYYSILEVFTKVLHVVRGWMLLAAGIIHLCNTRRLYIGVVYPCIANDITVLASVWIEQSPLIAWRCSISILQVCKQQIHSTYDSQME